LGGVVSKGEMRAKRWDAGKQKRTLVQGKQKKRNMQRKGKAKRLRRYEKSLPNRKKTRAKKRAKTVTFKKRSGKGLNPKGGKTHGDRCCHRRDPRWEGWVVIVSRGKEGIR